MSPQASLAWLASHELRLGWRDWVALVRWIIEPVALVRDTTMPKMGAGAVDARDMAAYLQRLR